MGPAKIGSRRTRRTSSRGRATPDAQKRSRARSTRRNSRRRQRQQRRQRQLRGGSRDCPICFESIEAPQPLGTIVYPAEGPEDHLFHRECLEPVMANVVGLDADGLPRLPRCPLCDKVFTSLVVRDAPTEDIDADAAEALNAARARAALPPRAAALVAADNARKRSRGEGVGAGAEDADRLSRRQRLADRFSVERARVSARTNDEHGYNAYRFSPEYVAYQDTRPTSYDPLWRNHPYFMKRLPNDEHDRYFTGEFDVEHPDKLVYDADTNLYARLGYDEATDTYRERSDLPALSPDDVHSRQQYQFATFWIRTAEIRREVRRAGERLEAERRARAAAEQHARAAAEHQARAAADQRHRARVAGRLEPQPRQRERHETLCGIQG